MASSSLTLASRTEPRTSNQPLASPLSTTPALYLTRLVDGKTKFCKFCGNRFCGVFRPKRTCDGCGGITCDGCARKMQARGNQSLRVCPGCDARLKVCPNFVDHIIARTAHGGGYNNNTVTTTSSQTSPPTSVVSSSSFSAVSSASASSPPSVMFSSIATQTPPCVVIAPSPSSGAPPSVLGTNGYTINMTMRPHFTPEPRPSASPFAWLLRAIGSSTNSDRSRISSNNNIRNSTSASISASSTNTNSNNIGSTNI
ncbi:unnamed protein product, partial [Ectocarpus fasciculatus]